MEGVFRGKRSTNQHIPPYTNLLCCALAQDTLWHTASCSSGWVPKVLWDFGGWIAKHLLKTERTARGERSWRGQVLLWAFFTSPLPGNLSNAYLKEFLIRTACFPWQHSSDANCADIPRKASA